MLIKKKKKDSELTIKYYFQAIHNTKFYFIEFYFNITDYIRFTGAPSMKF